MIKLFKSCFSLIFLLQQVSSRNILLVTTDDMTSTVFDEYPKHSFFDSANVFNALSSQPVCGPARAAILSGLRPDTTKIYNFETYLHTETMFSYFKKQGYDTFVTGKVFHTLPVDRNKQFEYNIGGLTSPRTCLTAGNTGCDSNKFYCMVKNSEDECAIKEIKQFFSSKIGKNGNWIAGVGFHRPHLQLTIKAKKRSKLCTTYVNSKDFQPPADFQYSLSNFQNSDLLYMKVPFGKTYTQMYSKAKYPSDFFVTKNTNTIKKMRQAYCDSSTETIGYFLDIVDTMYKILPESINNTDIVFVADHGFQIGQRGILGKNTLYPESTNIPLFFKIAGENRKRPLKTEHVSSVDIFPTLLQLHQKSLKLDGVSLFNNGQVAISQYPRCQPLGTIQQNDCMNGPNSCSREKITYMGYLIVRQIGGITYRFSEWYPFNEIRTCEWPYWNGIPAQFINRLGSWKVWNLQESSNTDFKGKPLFRELYTVNQRGLINSSNLINDSKYNSIINQLDQLIRTT